MDNSGQIPTIWYGVNVKNSLYKKTGLKNTGSALNFLSGASRVFRGQKEFLTAKSPK